MLEKILCVDDSSDIRAVLKIALEMIGGFDVCLCATGQEALEKIAKFKPDLILLDVVMPEMSGPEILNALKKNADFVSTPVIFMTGQQQRNERQELNQFGAIGLISKPFQPKELANQIKVLWADRPKV